MNEEEVKNALSLLFKEGGAWWSYPAHWRYEEQCFDMKSVALDGSFSLETLEQIVSILRLAEVRGGEVMTVDELILFILDLPGDAEVRIGAAGVSYTARN